MGTAGTSTALLFVLGLITTLPLTGDTRLTIGDTGLTGDVTLITGDTGLTGDVTLITGDTRLTGDVTLITRDTGLTTGDLIGKGLTTPGENTLKLPPLLFCIYFSLDKKIIES